MPSSHLTRQVFRRLLANEPIIHRGCLRQRAAYSVLCRRDGSNGHFGLRRLPTRQARTIFSFNVFSNSRESSEADMDPGMAEMMNLARRHRMQARLPPAKDVAESFKELFEAKLKSGQSLQDNQASLALLSLNHCLSTTREADGQEAPPLIALLDGADFITAAKVLANTPSTASKAHVELASVLYSTCHSFADQAIVDKCLLARVANLCGSGATGEARNLVLQRETELAALSEANSNEAIESGPGSSAQTTDDIASAWIQVLRGFARERNDEEVNRTADLIAERSFPQAQQQNLTRQLLRSYTNTKNGDRVKKQWAKYHEDIFRSEFQQSWPNAQMLGQDIKELLAWCLLHDDQTFGHAVVRDVMKITPPKPVWDATFIWAAGTGKGADAINRMIGVMEAASRQSRKPNESWLTADAATINALVEFAITKNDPYLAERFVALGRDRNIAPDARTYVLQIEYRIKFNDLDGALAAYSHFRNLEPSNDDLVAINRLVVTLCASKRASFDTIMNIAGDLTDRRARFEPETVKSLTLLHLSRGEKEDVIDLLNTHAFHYSTTEREVIRDAIIAFCTDQNTSLGHAWDAYNVIQSIFDETPREQRTRLMISFFDRRRPDMACNIFLHMRQDTRDANNPTIKTYIAAFTNIAKLAHVDSLDVIHNQLKLDYNIQSNTRLINSLMLAFIACGRSYGALSLWDDIVASREGPTYNSLHIALRACEKAPFGDVHAQKLWALIRRRGVEVDNALWVSYIVALAGNGNNDLALGMLDTAFQKSDVEVSPFLLGSLLMTAPGEAKQQEIIRYATDKFPGLWAEVEKMGIEDVDMWTTDKMVRGIDRSLEP